MKTTMKSFFLLAVVAVLAACNQNPEAQENHDGHNHNPSAAAANSPVTLNLKDEKLNAVYQQYTHLTAALTEGKTAEAKVAATAIELGAKQIQGAESLVTAATGITAANDIEAQRTIYAGLSKDFIALLKKTGLDSGELYIAHCPMALNDKGAEWVAQTKEIRNPYFGESMLTCGSITETVK